MRLSYHKVYWLTALIAVVLVVVSRSYAQSSSLQVVPGAAGFGMTTRAAYGGGSSPTIYRITNLNDSGAGSLRAALEASGPRVVIFEISGTISLNSPIAVRSSYLTVAGQTAPSPGITVRNFEIEVYAQDVLLQHFRVRLGASAGGVTDDNVAFFAASSGSNLILDHMSLSWSAHVNVGFTQASSNSTIWRCFITEGLATNNFVQPTAGVSRGLLINNTAKNISTLQSLLAHNYERNPYAKGDTTTYTANNLFYNFSGGSYYLDPDGAGPLQASLIGNYYKAGGDTPDPTAMIFARYLQAGSRIYYADNTLDGGGKSLYPIAVSEGIDPTVGSPPVTVPGYTPMASTAVKDFVLANSGARPADRDAVDARIVGSVTARTGSQISHQNDVGGWPTLAVNARTLTLPTNPHTVTSSGYTNLEVWLHGYAAAVEGTVAPSAPAAPLGLRIVVD